MKDEKIQVKMIQSVDEVDRLETGKLRSGSGSGTGSGYGSGSGSGWGSGEGSGYPSIECAYLIAGNANYMYVHNSYTHIVDFEWGDGVFNAIDPKPSLTLNSAYISQIDFTHMYKIVWASPYRIKFTCSDPYDIHDFFYDIPQYYRADHEPEDK